MKLATRNESLVTTLMAIIGRCRVLTSLTGKLETLRAPRATHFGFQLGL